MEVYKTNVNIIGLGSGLGDSSYTPLHLRGLITNKNIVSSSYSKVFPLFIISFKGWGL